MNKRLKIKYFFLIVFIAIASFISFQMVKVHEIDMKSLENSLIKEGYASSKNKADYNKLRDLYSFDIDTIEEFIFFPPSTNMEGKEILIIKSKTDFTQENFDKIEKRILNQEESFKNYSPDQFKILENRYFKAEGDYLILIVDEKVNQIKKILEGNYR